MACVCLSQASRLCGRCGDPHAHLGTRHLELSHAAASPAEVVFGPFRPPFRPPAAFDHAAARRLVIVLPRAIAKALVFFHNGGEQPGPALARTPLGI
eukprot:23525-Chlamydomonas_euryale.AAC.6